MKKLMKMLKRLLTTKKGSSFALRIEQDDYVLNGHNAEINVIQGSENLHETIKCSSHQNIVIKNLIIEGSYEDCVDIVRGKNIKFLNCTFIPEKYTSRSITIKGGVNNVVFENCKFYKGILPWHVQLGDYTIYDAVKRPKVRNVVFNGCIDMHRKPIKVLVIHSKKAEFINTRGFNIKIPRLFVWLYFALMRKIVKTSDNINLTIHNWEK